MSVEEFNNGYLHPLIEKLSKEDKKSCYIAGDFNFNLLKTTTHTPTTEFLNIFESALYRPTITLPTRVTSRSSNLIDNIFVNANFNLLECGNLTCSISDHYPQFVISPLNDNNSLKKNKIFRRDLNNFDQENFILDYFAINTL